MSGGVDSSVAAYLLKQQGHDVTGVTLRLLGDPYDGEHLLSAEAEARSVCRGLGIPHVVLDCRELFSRTVIDTFVSEYEAGRTPNPCVLCNPTVKFGYLGEYARSAGFDALATGHYVRKTAVGHTANTPGGNGPSVLARAADEKKDQSYFLWGLTRDMIDFSLFPLGDMTKQAVRDIAMSVGFPCASARDSQDICFIPDGDYAAYIASVSDKPAKPGRFLDKDGHVLGTHTGVSRFTVGQRRGLGIALGQPMFVLSKNAVTGDVVLVPDDGLYADEVTVSSVNISHPAFVGTDFNAFVKIRYSRGGARAVLSITDGGLLIRFEQPVRAPAPGQSAVFYTDDGILIGGGIIQ